MTEEKNAGRAAGEVMRRRGIALSRHGIDRFLNARRRLTADPGLPRHLTLAECAARAKVGLRTLTRCLRGERVDRRSIELIFFGIGIELEPRDVAPEHVSVLAFTPRAENRPMNASTPDSYA